MNSQAENSLSKPISSSLDSLENAMWQALELDKLKDDMTSKNFSNQGQVLMGTGSTHNACNHCSNSASTHGCGTCG